jgi:hypothetical protein
MGMFDWLFCRQISETADAVLWLLECDPDGWQQTTHYLIHPRTKVAIWISNEDYALRLCHSFEGGCGVEIKPNKFDRKVIWSFVRKYKEAASVGGPIPDAIRKWRHTHKEQFK